MTGTVVITEEPFGRLQKVKFAWTATSGGAAGDTTAHAYTGVIVRFLAVPGTGDDAPTDQFDVVVNDEDNYDVLAGQGANLSNAANTTVVAGMGAVANDRLTLAVTNAGDSNKGTCIVYIDPRGGVA
jgi:hypothetical protein